MAFITGNGFKTQEVVQHLVDRVEIDPTYTSFEAAGIER